MSDLELGWKFAEDFPVETEPLAAARLHSLEHGVEAVSPAVGSQLAVLAAASNARQIVEIGTGLGVSAVSAAGVESPVASAVPGGGFGPLVGD